MTNICHVHVEHKEDEIVLCITIYLHQEYYIPFKCKRLLSRVDTSTIKDISLYIYHAFKRRNDDSHDNVIGNCWYIM